MGTVGSKNRSKTRAAIVTNQRAKNTAPSPPPPNAVPRQKSRQNRNNPKKQSPLATPQTPACAPQQLDSLKRTHGGGGVGLQRRGTVEAIGRGMGRPYLDTNHCA